MSLYDLVSDLQLTVEDLRFDTAAVEVGQGFTRKTTTVTLGGLACAGRGEDVTYDAAEHDADRLPRLDLAGSWTLGSLSVELDRHDLFPSGEPGQAAYRDYRRWAFESAALDLALQQAGSSLGDALGRVARPLSFVSSTRAT